MDRSKVVRAAAPVAVFAAVLGAIVVLGRGGQSFPRPLPLAAAAGGTKAEDAAAPAMYGGEIHIGDNLLEGLPEHGAAYDLDGVTRERVAALAKALGVDGEAQEKDGAWYVEETPELLVWVDKHTGQWVLTPDKGITAGVGEVAPWTGEVDVVASAPAAQPGADPSGPVEKPNAEPTPVCLAPDGCGPTMAPPPPPDGSTGSSGSGSSGSGTVTCSTTIPPDCPSPSPYLPVRPLPSDDAVRDALAKVMAVTGQQDAKITIEAGYIGKDGFADPVVDGLPTFGYRTVLTLEAPATIARGSGFLVTPERVALYPLLSPREAVERGGSGGAVGIMAPYPAPSPSSTPAPREATKVRLGLMYMPSFEPDAAGYLAPAWLLSFEGVSFEEPFLALPDRYVATPPPPTDSPDEPVCSPEPCGKSEPGTPQSSPAQVDPATPPITVFE